MGLLIIKLSVVAYIGLMGYLSVYKMYMLKDMRKVMISFGISSFLLFVPVMCMILMLYTPLVETGLFIYILFNFIVLVLNAGKYYVTKKVTLYTMSPIILCVVFVTTVALSY